MKQTRIKNTGELVENTKEMLKWNSTNEELYYTQLDKNYGILNKKNINENILNAIESLLQLNNNLPLKKETEDIKKESKNNTEVTAIHPP